MPAIAMRILVTGTRAPGTTAILARMAARGFGARAVETAKEARQMLETFRFDVVLAAESLADGRGYDLAGPTVRRSGTLIVSVPLSGSCIWLPVIERGVNVLGKRALNAQTLELEIDLLLLGLRDVAGGKKPVLSASLQKRRPNADRAKASRRKNGGAAA